MTFKRNNNRPDKRRELELLHKWISELKRESKKKPVIVEGNKDRVTMAKFGVKTQQIHKIHNSLDERVEELSKNNECIPLFDLDKAGRKLHAKIKGDLQHAGVKVNSSFRNFLLAKTRLRFIEGLDTYLKNLQSNMENGKKRNSYSWNR